MARKALLVGIDYYLHANLLGGCVSDATLVGAALERHYDGTKNFTTETLTGTGENKTVSRSELLDSVTSLFSGDEEIALFYFAGHGSLEQSGGYLICSDTLESHAGLSLRDVVSLANKSKVQSRIIVLDSCHSGTAGSTESDGESVMINTGVTILTASKADQYAAESNDGGLFTSLFISALNGTAANLIGDVTPGAVYAHIDQSLGPWDQRPMFKTNVKDFISLKRVFPPIEHNTLLKLNTYFSDSSSELSLDPSFEPQSDDPNDKNTKIFDDLQKMVKVNLVVPNGEEHMYYAAMNSKSCILTPLGEHYRSLIAKGKI